MGTNLLYSLDHNTPEPRWTPRAHSGLWWAKFSNQWVKNRQRWQLLEPDQKHNEPGGKFRWIQTLTGESQRVGDREFLREAANRRRELIEMIGGQTLAFRTNSRLVTGIGLEHPVENGMLFHHTLGVPYLPGTSVKGLVRAWASNWEGTDDADKIFGSPELGIGSLRFFDALPQEPVRLEMDVMTPHYKDWYAGNPDAVPADWHSPTPIHFLTVAANTPFEFALAPRSPDALEHLKRAIDWLQQALEWQGSGAKTAVGYGHFVPA